MNDNDIDELINIVEGIGKITDSNFNHWINVLKTANTFWNMSKFKINI